MKNVAAILTVLLGALFVSGAVAQQVELTPGNVVEVTAEQPGFSIFTGILEASGLADELAQGASYTLFAPTDDAFMDLARERGISLTSMLERTNLVDLIEQHFIAGEALTVAELEDLVDAAGEDEFHSLDTRGGDDVLVSERISNQVYLNGDTQIVETLDAENGVVHAVDRVIDGLELTTL